MTLPYFPNLPPVLGHVPAELLLALLGVSLVLIFAGKILVKVVAFLVVGLVGAAFGGTLVAQYVSPQWALIGLLLGFAIGGLLGMALLPLGVGLVVGYAGYIAALDFALGTTMALVAGVAFFVVGAMLSNKVIGVVTAVAGGLLLFDVLTRYGLGSTMATVVAALLTVVGLWVQVAPARRPSQPTATQVGGQPSART